MREHTIFHTDEEDGRKLEPLGRVERHQHDGAVVGAFRKLVGVGDERDLLEELVHVLEVACRAHQLREVLESSFGLDRVLALEFGQIAGGVEDELEHRTRTALDRVPELIEQREELGDALDRASGDLDQ